MAKIRPVTLIRSDRAAAWPSRGYAVQLVWIVSLVSQVREFAALRHPRLGHAVAVSGVIQTQQLIRQGLITLLEPRPTKVGRDFALASFSTELPRILIQLPVVRLSVFVQFIE